MTFQTPLFLLLLLPLAALSLAIFGWIYVAGSRRRTALFATRCVSLALLVLALAQPVWGSTNGGPLIFVMDRSASINVAMRSSEVGWLRQMLRDAPAGTARWIVTFAGAPSLGPLPAHSASLTVGGAPGSTQTNIQDAVRLGLGAAPDNARLVLLTDGLQTQGDALGVAALARARHTRVDVAIPTGRPTPDAAVTRFQVAPAAHQGDPLPFLLTVRSNVLRPATISFLEDGHVSGRQTVPLRLGDNPFVLTIRAPKQLGWHAYRVSVSMSGDAVPENNALDATSRVVSRPRILIVAPAPRDPFSALLGRLGIASQVATPRTFPNSSAGLRAFDGVVLDDLPATALSPRQVSMLDGAVRLGGTGLLVLGGPQSLTLGHYSLTPLERLLPVYSTPPSSLRQGNVALQLVLDRSGSMNNLAGSQPKILMAQAAANIAVDFARDHKDDLGVVSFDYYPHILVPMQKVATPDVALRIHGTINRLTADGGTNIYAALRDGLTQVLKSNAPYRHIILMTDGVSDPANYTILLRQFPRAHITLSAVAMGTDADTHLLQRLATDGKGRYYFTNNASDMPHIFAKEVRLSAGEIRVTGNIPVALGASSPIVRDLTGGRLPAVRGYPATTLKPGAVSTLIAHGEGRGSDPILAQWQYGLGRVLVWTPGGATWGGSWMSARSKLWDNAVRWLLRGIPHLPLEPALTTGGAAPHLTVDTFQNTGSSINLAYLDAVVQAPGKRRSEAGFQQTAPGTYEASLPDTRPGVYQVTVRELDAPQNQSDVAIALPYPRELAPAPPNTGLLSQLAAETGGTMLSNPNQLKIGSGSSVELWWPLAALSLLFFLIDVAVRLLGLGAGEDTNGASVEIDSQIAQS